METEKKINNILGSRREVRPRHRWILKTYLK
jgi:hypothetical protein